MKHLFCLLVALAVLAGCGVETITLSHPAPPSGPPPHGARPAAPASPAPTADGGRPSVAMADLPALLNPAAQRYLERGAQSPAWEPDVTFDMTLLAEGGRPLQPILWGVRLPELTILRFDNPDALPVFEGLTLGTPPDSHADWGPPRQLPNDEVGLQFWHSEDYTLALEYDPDLTAVYLARALPRPASGYTLFDAANPDPLQTPDAGPGAISFQPWRGATATLSLYGFVSVEGDGASLSIAPDCPGVLPADRKRDSVVLLDGTLNELAILSVAREERELGQLQAAPNTERWEARSPDGRYLASQPEGIMLFENSHLLLRDLENEFPDWYFTLGHFPSALYWLSDDVFVAQSDMGRALFVDATTGEILYELLSPAMQGELLLDRAGSVVRFTSPSAELYGPDGTSGALLHALSEGDDEQTLVLTYSFDDRGHLALNPS